MRLISLFAGIGGFDLAAEWMGWETAVVVEIDPFCRAVLAKNFPRARQHDDIKTFDATPYRGSIDLVCGGFPCQPFSTAGARKGNDDPRALWPQMLRIIREAAPAYVVAENVSGLLSQGGGVAFERVCADLEDAGYTLQPVVLPACGVGAPHRRDRLWITAHASGAGRQERDAPALAARAGFGAGLRDADDATHAASLRPQAGRGRELPQRTGAGAAQVGDEERPALRAAADGRRAAPATHAARERQQQPGGAIAELRERAGDGGKEECFRLTEPPLCVRHDGLPDWLDGNLNQIIYHHGDAIKAHRNEILSEVWRGVSETPLWDKARGRYAFSSPAVLLEIMQLFTACANGSYRLPQAGEEAYRDFLRSVRNESGVGGAPHQQGYNRQQPGQYPDALPGLPHEVALAAEAVDRWHRTPRAKQLKAYGNAIVPQVALQVFKALVQAAAIN